MPACRLHRRQTHLPVPPGSPTCPCTVVPAAVGRGRRGWGTAGAGGSLREQPWGSQSLGVVSHLGWKSEVRPLFPEVLVWTSVAEFTPLVQVIAPHPDSPGGPQHSPAPIQTPHRPSPAAGEPACPPPALPPHGIQNKKQKTPQTKRLQNRL